MHMIRRQESSLFAESKAKPDDIMVNFSSICLFILLYVSKMNKCYFFNKRTTITVIFRKMKMES